eukprot:SAG11_NODE_3346_length_2508_cov_5.035699_1_plen_166_part_10
MKRAAKAALMGAAAGPVDDAAILAHAKTNRTQWIEWLQQAGLTEIGNDPKRHNPATRMRFWTEITASAAGTASSVAAPTMASDGTDGIIESGSDGSSDSSSDSSSEDSSSDTTTSNDSDDSDDSDGSDAPSPSSKAATKSAAQAAPDDASIIKFIKDGMNRDAWIA